jgi:hypothetical protein
MILRMGLDFVLTVTAAGVGQDVFHAETFRHFDGISVQLMNLGALHRVGMDNIGPYMQRVELDVVDLAQCFDLTNVAVLDILRIPAPAPRLRRRISRLAHGLDLLFPWWPRRVPPGAGPQAIGRAGQTDMRGADGQVLLQVRRRAPLKHEVVSPDIGKKGKGAAP